MVHSPSSFDDSLYCREENWEGKGEFDVDCVFEESFNGGFSCGELSDAPIPLSLTDQDLAWENHELATLLSKEEENQLHRIIKSDQSAAIARAEAVDWMLRVRAHFSFSLQTALMAVDYFDRFFFRFEFQSDKPWLVQLAAAACLSVAAKVEESHVPLLVDLQVVETKYLFEAKTIQRMEILILSTLQWRMNTVTPFSFVDYMVRRLGLKNHLCLEILRGCEMVLFTTISDCRFMAYLPSELAAATMLHIIGSVDPSVESRLLTILGTDKEKVQNCEDLIIELASEGKFLLHPNKRNPVPMPESPNDVFGVSFSVDNSNESWSVSSKSVCSSPEPPAKRIRFDQDQHFERFGHPSVNHLHVSR